MPVLAVLLALGCLLLNERGWKSLGDPAVAIAILFLAAVGLLPFLRRYIAANRAPSKTHLPAVKLWWLMPLLIWNGLGAFIALYGILSVILSFQLHDPPTWCGSIFECWFVTMPVTSIVAIVLLWRSRVATASRVLLLVSFVNLVLWGYFILMLIMAMS